MLAIIIPKTSFWHIWVKKWIRNLEILEITIRIKFNVLVSYMFQYRLFWSTGKQCLRAVTSPKQKRHLKILHQNTTQESLESLYWTSTCKATTLAGPFMTNCSVCFMSYLSVQCLGYTECFEDLENGSWEPWPYQNSKTSLDVVPETHNEVL